MPRLMHPLLLLLARATEPELVRMVEYLKAENRILRDKLPKRITVTPAERSRLLKLGKRLGEVIKAVISVVHPSTFARWIREEAAGKLPKKRGRKRTAEEIRVLILRMALDSEWGYRRIWGELKKLRINVSRSTVARILKENGFDPGPKRGSGTWNEFVRRHMQTLWACDFFTKTVWTLHGPVEYYVLFFVHVATRRAHVVGMTPNPNGAWMEEQARKLCEYFRHQGDARPTHIIRDRDTKFTAKFCSIPEV